MSTTRHRHALCLTVLLIALAAALAGCGQKGDLYMPDDEPQNLAQH